MKPLLLSFVFLLLVTSLPGASSNTPAALQADENGFTLEYDGARILSATSSGPVNVTSRMPDRVRVAQRLRMAGKGTVTLKLTATVKLVDAGKRFLVLLLPDTDQALRAIVVRADDPAFRPGQIMIMNFAPETLAADLGGEKLTLTPGSQAIFRAQRKNELANYQAWFYQAKDGKPKVFAASLWPYFDAKRAFVFLYMDRATGSPSFRSVDEFTDCRLA